MPNRADIISEAIDQMRADPDPRWQAVADLLDGSPLGYARLLDRNQRLAPANYPDADRGVAVANAYLDRTGKLAGHSCPNCEGVDPASCAFNKTEQGIR